MRKIILLIFILSFFAVSVNAVTETQVFSSWVFTDQSVQVNDKVYHFMMTRGLSQVVVSFDDEIINIAEGECDTKAYTKICFEDTDYDLGEREYKAEVIIYEIVPDIKVTRTIDEDEIFVGQEAKITVELENEGGRVALNPIYTQEFPSFIQITDVTGARREGQKIIFKGNIDQAETEEFSYKIKPLRAAELNVKAKLNYFDGIVNKTEYTDSLNIDIENFIEIIPTLGSDEVLVGDKSNLTINLTNHIEEDVKVNLFRVDIPGNVIISNYPRQLRKEGNSFFWNGEFDQNETFEFERFKFQTKNIGFVSVFMHVNATYEGREYIIEKTAKLEVENIELFLNTNLEDGDLFESGQEEDLQVWIQNPNNDVYFRDLKVNVGTDLANISNITIRRLNATEYKRIVDIKFTAPYVESTTKFPLKITAKYETEYGDSFTKELEVDNIKVEPIKDLTISHSFSDKTPEEKDRVRLTVKVKNNRDVDITRINVYDEVPLIISKEGISSALVNIDAKDELTVYSYVLHMPKTSEKVEYKIKTFAEYEWDNIKYNDTKESVITLSPRDVDLKVTGKIEDSPYHIGQLLSIEYTLKNSESDDAIRNIIITLPKQKEFDIVGKDSYLIESIGAGEEIVLSDLAKVRVKVNKSSVRLEKGKVTYKDDDGDVFDTTTNTIGLNVKGGYVQGPAVIIDKVVPKEVEAGDKFRVLLNVSNVGDSRAQLVLTDAGHTWSTEIASGRYQLFGYDAAVEHSIILEPAVARYNYLSMPFYAYSDEMPVTVKGEPAPVVEVEEEIVVEEVGVEDTGESALIRFWNALLRWFS